MTAAVLSPAPPGDLRLTPRVTAGVGAVLLLAWLWYLAANVPLVSRGDFFLAMLRVARSVDQGHVLYAITWPVHVLGGHIVFYERVLQLANYYLFGFSPLFVKVSAMAAWSLLGLGAYLFVRRLPLSEGARLAALVLLAVLTFNPVPWLTIVWADATIPYLSSLVALLFVGPLLVRGTESGWRAAGTWRMLLCCVAVIFGSGVGWAILPTLAWLAALRKFRRGQGRKVLVITVAAALVLALLLWMVLRHFELALRLGDVTESLLALPANAGRVAAYYLSLFATFFGVSERPWNVALGSLFCAASLLTYFLYRRREGRATEPELLYVFGMLGLVLVTLGRWKIAADRGGAVPFSYYHLFALPAYYGFVAMALRLVPGRAAQWAGAAGIAVLAACFAIQFPLYHRQVLGQSDSYRQMIRPLQGWRMTEATRLIGSPELNQEIFFEFLPMLKSSGRWPALSGAFLPYKSTRMAPPETTANGFSCSPTRRNLAVLLAEPDRRATYGALRDLPDYWRFVGVARSPYDCDQRGLAVSLVDRSGVVLCRSWTTPNVHWAYPDEQHRSVTSSGFAFDFSCPVEGGEYFLVAQDAAGKVLEVLALPDKPRPMQPPRATENGRNCGAYRNLDVLASEKMGSQGRRFVGVARNRAGCDDRRMRVSLVAADGTVACRAITTTAVASSWPVPAQHRDVVASGFAFDLTCVPPPGEAFLVSEDGAGKVVETLKVQP